MTFNSRMPATIDQETGDQAAVELPAAQHVNLPISALVAALECAARSDDRYYLNSVLIQSEGEDIRIVATDGHRILVQSMPLGDQVMPEWAIKGVLIDRDQLAEALPMLRRNSSDGAARCRIGTGEGHQFASIASMNGFVEFKAKLVDGKFPDYKRVIECAGPSLAHAGAVPMQSGTLNAKYLGAAAKIAMLLDRRETKVEPSVTGFMTQAEAASVFLFPHAPGAVYIVMPVKADTTAYTVQSLAVLAPAARASISALRAHASRQVKLLNVANNDKAREEISARKAAFEARIAELEAVLKDAPKKLTAKA